MRKIIIALLVFVLVALNWAALHDILKGEPNVWMEWTVVLTTALIPITFFIRRIVKRFPIL